MSISPKSNFNGKSVKIDCMIVYPKEKELQPVANGEVVHKLPTIDPKVFSNKVTLKGNVLSNGAMTRNVETSRIEKYKTTLKEQKEEIDKEEKY